MLDYALLSAGQFRKLVKNFDLRESIDDVVKILKLKADELNINIQVKIHKI